MDTAIKALETKAVSTLPLGSPLILSWYQEGARFAAAQLIAKKNSELILNVWKAGGKDPGVKPEVWTLKVDGGFLTDSRRQFRCTLQLPSEKELASIKNAMERFPAPTVPLEGQRVQVRYLDLDEGGELPEFVGVVTEQRIDTMHIDASYYSIKQRKVIMEPLEFSRAANGRWSDWAADLESTVRIITRPEFDRWLVEDEKTQRAKSAPPAKAAAVATHTTPKAEPRQQSVSKKPVPAKGAKLAKEK